MRSNTLLRAIHRGKPRTENHPTRLILRAKTSARGNGLAWLNGHPSSGANLSFDMVASLLLLWVVPALEYDFEASGWRLIPRVIENDPWY
jgi:hypothetical protein